MLGDLGAGQAFELEENEHLATLFGECREQRIETSELFLTLRMALRRTFGRHALLIERRDRPTLATTGVAACDANRYLWDAYIPEHNARFSVEPESSSDVHKPLLAKHDLDEILSVRTERTVYNDFTVRYKKKFLQIFAGQSVRPKSKVLVETRLDGSMHVRHKDWYLNFKTLPKRPEKSLMRRKYAVPGSPLHRYYKPAAAHPWRRYGSDVAQSDSRDFVFSSATR